MMPSMKKRNKEKYRKDLKHHAQYKEPLFPVGLDFFRDFEMTLFNLIIQSLSDIYKISQLVNDGAGIGYRFLESYEAQFFTL